MGSYINPGGWPPFGNDFDAKAPSKEAWLGQHGTPWDPALGFDSVPDGQLPVCWVDNGYMTSAGIAYNADELASFLYPDPRPKRWFLVPTALLVQVSDLRSEDVYWRRTSNRAKIGVP